MYPEEHVLRLLNLLTELTRRHVRLIPPLFVWGHVSCFHSMASEQACWGLWLSKPALLSDFQLMRVSCSFFLWSLSGIDYLITYFVPIKRRGEWRVFQWILAFSAARWKIFRNLLPFGGRDGNPFSILTWRIPWTEESGGLQSKVSQRVRYDWSDLARTQVWKSTDTPILLSLAGKALIWSFFQIHFEIF